MESSIGFIIITVVGLISLVLPLASIVILVNLLRKIEYLEKKVDDLSTPRASAANVPLAAPTPNDA